MQQVWCTKCGKSNLAGCRWCVACAEVLRPAYLTSQPGGGGQKICPVCRTVNQAEAVSCTLCGTDLSNVPIVGGAAPREQSQSRPTPPPAAAGGSRLSRLAQARREKEAAEGRSPAREGVSDWLGGLRSDAPPPLDYATGMDEDDEIDPELSAALQEAKQEEEDTSLFASPSDFAREIPPSAQEATLPDIEPPLPMFMPDDLAATLPVAGMPPKASDEGLPDWLQNMGGPASIPPPPASPSASATPKPSESQDNVPDWLRELSGSPSVSSAPPSRPPTNPTNPTPEKDTGDLPDWLHQMKGTSPSPPSSSPSEPPPSNEVPVWLRQTTDALPAPARPSFGDIEVEERLSFAFDEPIDRQSRNDDLNPRIGSSNEATQPSTSGLFRRPIGLTDLLGLPPSSIEDVPTRPMPTKLDQDAPVELSPWLQGLPPPTLDEPQSVGFEPPPTDDELSASVVALPDLPDFLRDMSPVDAVDLAPVVPDYPNDLVPWLQGLRPPALDEEELPLEPATALPDLPDFLVPMVDSVAPLPAARPPLRPAPTEDELTNTSHSFSLRDMMQATDELTEAMREQDNAFAPDVAGLQPLPDFGGLDSSSSEKEAEEYGVPSWLNQSAEAPEESVKKPSAPGGFVIPPLRFPDEDEEETEMLPFALPAFEGRSAPPSNQTTLASISGGAPPDFELPDFLSEPRRNQAGQPSAATDADIPDFLRGMSDPGSTSSGFAPTVQEPALPDFLRDMQAEAPAEAAASEADMPDFLRDMQAQPFPAPFVSRPASDEVDLPDFLRDMSGSAAPAAPTSQDADLPDFLRESGGPAFAFQPESTESDLSFFENLGIKPPENSSPATQATPIPASEGASLDFLRSEAAAIPDAPEDDMPMPDWLQALSSGQAPAPTPPAPKKPPSYSPMSMGTSRAEEQQAELPSWLQEDGAMETEPAPSISPAGPDFAWEEAGADQAEPTLPDFLGGSGSIGQDQDLPDFLREPGSPGREEASDLPDFLRGGATPTQAESSLPDDLFGLPVEPGRSQPTADFSPPREADPTVRGLQFKTDDLAPSAQLPNWLSETPAAPNEPDFAISGKLPDWLDESEANPLPLALDDLTAEESVGNATLPPPAFESALGEAATNSPGRFASTNFLGDIEGPAWLRTTNQPKPLKPDTGQLAAEPAQAPSVPSWLRTVATTPVEEVAPSSGPITFQSSDDEQLPQLNLPPQLASAAVLTTLLAPAALMPARTALPASPAAPAARRLALSPAQLVRYGTFLLLLAVALFALLSPVASTPLTVTPLVQTFYNQIDALAPNSKVLITYDWEADRSGEMRPMAQAITQHVMSKRARLLTISLNPQGPALASQVTDELARNPNYGNSNFYVYEKNYLNLGWRTGNEAAVRGLFDQMGELREYKNGRQAGETPAMQGINSLADFDLIIVLAGDEGGVRTWVEQFGIQPGARMLFGVPAAVEPVAKPYALGLTTATQEIRSTEKQVRGRGLLAGLSGTVQYGQLLRDKLNLRTEPKLSLEERWSAQGLAALLLVLIVVVANVVYLVRRRE